MNSLLSRYLTLSSTSQRREMMMMMMLLMRIKSAFNLHANAIFSAPPYTIHNNRIHTQASSAYAA